MFYSHVNIFRTLPHGRLSIYKPQTDPKTVFDLQHNSFTTQLIKERRKIKSNQIEGKHSLTPLNMSLA